MTPALYTQHGWSANDALNRLQDQGLVSDLCLTLEDIPIGSSDYDRAVRFLENWGK